MSPPKGEFFEVVPWMNSEEWNLVYSALFSENVDDQQWGLGKVQVWKSRTHPDISTGIDATASLIRAQIQDYLVQNEKSPCDSTNIAHLYSMAIIRFVNVVAELRQLRNTKVNLLAIACSYGIPEWIVDLRNQASHSQIPSITMLRSGAQVALEWLRIHYWEKERLIVKDAFMLKKNTPKAELDLEAIIVEYKHLKIHKNNNRNDRDSAQEEAIILQKLDAILKKKKNRKLFIEIFVNKGHFLLNERTLIDILSDEEKGFLHSNSIDIPNSFLEFWKRLLITMQKYPTCMETLVECILNLKSFQSILLERLSISWIVYILNFKYNEKRNCKEYLQMLNTDKVDEINWNNILLSLLKTKNKYLSILFPLIIEVLKPQLSGEKQQHLLAILAIYIGAVSDPPLKTNVVANEPFTVRDLLAISGSQTPACSSTSSIGNWRLCSDWEDWARCPFGFCPSKKYQNSKSLELSLATLPQEQSNGLNESGILDQDNHDIEIEEPEVVSSEEQMEETNGLYQPFDFDNLIIF